MAKKDFEELEATAPKLIERFITSGEPFFPSETYQNANKQLSSPYLCYIKKQHLKG